MRSPLTAIAFLVILTVGLSCPQDAMATGSYTLSTTGSYGIDTAIAMTKNADINFGTVKALTADTYTINTSGTVSHAGSGAELFGTPAAGNITITGSTTSTINVSVGSYVADNGVTLQNATCAYNGGGAAACSLNAQAAPGVGKTLLLGVQAVVDGSQAAGSSAAPSFTVTVTYP